MEDQLKVKNMALKFYYGQDFSKVGGFTINVMCFNSLFEVRYAILIRAETEIVELKMVCSCAAYGCKNRCQKGLSFHRFPQNPELRAKWVQAVRRAKWSPSHHTVLCSLHFEESCFDRTGQTCRLREGSIPTIFNFSKQVSKGGQKNRQCNIMKTTLSERPYTKTPVTKPRIFRKRRASSDEEVDPSPSTSYEVWDHYYTNETMPRKLQQRINALMDVVDEENKKVETSREKIARLETKIQTMKDALNISSD